MKKHRINWSFGNLAFPAWEIATAAGQMVLRRNHALVRTGDRLCQGWDVWLDSRFVGALGSRTLQDFALLTRGELLAVLRPACCGRHRTFQDELTRTVGFGGLRVGAGRKPFDAQRRVQLSTVVAPQTLVLLDELRGTRSRGQYLDWLLAQCHRSTR
jgi:hypothetical protein